MEMFNFGLECRESHYVFINKILICLDELLPSVTLRCMFIQTWGLLKEPLLHEAIANPYHDDDFTSIPSPCHPVPLDPWRWQPFSLVAVYYLLTSADSELPLPCVLPLGFIFISPIAHLGHLS